MRIALFDGILEQHVSASLHRALLRRGHTVMNTGKLAQGFKFVSDPSALAKIDAAIDEVYSFHPDAVFVFRPASLPMPQLLRLKAAGGKLIVWLSDDPVLWKLSYGPVIDHYDIVLHCGDASVLSFYEQRHGRATGVNFPFWSDSVAFPYSYRALQLESDALFLGNVGDRVRRQRYFDLAGLGLDLRIHGKTGDDYFGLAAGFLDSDSEIVDAGSRARLAINIPQLFEDHRGLDTWFDGLGALGSFQFPSRIVQYAAMGIPTVSLQPGTAQSSTVFPELRLVGSIRELKRESVDLLADECALKELSRAMHRRFLRSFSADSRVLALESLMVDDSWRRLDAGSRAQWFADFDGARADNCGAGEASVPGARAETVVVGEDSASSDVRSMLLAHYDNPPEPKRILTIMIIGRGRSDHVSPMTIATRALKFLGHNVVQVNPLAEGIGRADPTGEYVRVIDVARLYLDAAVKPDVILFVGDRYLPEPVQVGELRAKHGVRFIAHALESDSFSNRIARLVGPMDHSTFINDNAPMSFIASSLDAVSHLPDLVDRPYIRLLNLQKNRVQRVAVLYQREGHLKQQGKIIDELGTTDQIRFCVEPQATQPRALAEIARSAFSTVTVVLADPSRPGVLPCRLIGHALVGGGLTVVPRNSYSVNGLKLGDHAVAADSGGELAKKMWRLQGNPRRLEAMRNAAVRLGLDKYSAEEALQRVLDTVVPPNRDLQYEGVGSA